MERNFLKRKVFRLNRPVAAKTGFPPFASRSLPFRQLRGSNPGCKPGRARKRTRKKDGFCGSKSRSMRSMQARPCAEAHTKTVSKLSEFSKKIAKKRTKVLKKLHLFRKLSKICLSKNEKPKICGFYSLFFSKNSFSD